MGKGLWLWSRSPFGWWIGSREGFEVTLFVFERHGWAIRIESRQELWHFSEGYDSHDEARREAERWADFGSRRRDGMVPSTARHS